MISFMLQTLIRQHMGKCFYTNENQARVYGMQAWSDGMQALCTGMVLKVLKQVIFKLFTNNLFP